jgi:hypothetical protein
MPPFLKGQRVVNNTIANLFRLAAVADRAAPSLRRYALEMIGENKGSGMSANDQKRSWATRSLGCTRFKANELTDMKRKASSGALRYRFRNIFLVKRASRFADMLRRVHALDNSASCCMRSGVST